ncbi:hypothetical protein [Moraxella lacunata]|uniref:hypothetical protein n=1 Tax=Moraxella lacunata TaxID=477 RepID=UPI003EE14331
MTNCHRLYRVRDSGMRSTALILGGVFIKYEHIFHYKNDYNSKLGVRYTTVIYRTQGKIL